MILADISLTEKGSLRVRFSVCVPRMGGGEGQVFGLLTENGIGHYLVIGL